MSQATLESMDESDLNLLKDMKKHPEFNQGPFGITRIQRHLRFGYNRSVRLQDAGIKAGILVRVQEKQYLTVFAD